MTSWKRASLVGLALATALGIMLCVLALWLPVLYPATQASYSPRRPGLRFAVISDLQPICDHELAIARDMGQVMNLLTPPPSLVIGAGDLAGEYGPQGPLVQVRQSLAPVLDRGVPFIPAIGNHEKPPELFAELYAGASAARQAAADPVNECTADRELTFSFNWKGVHFVVLNPFKLLDWHFDPAVLDWLEQDLDQYASRPTFVVCHLPAWPVSVYEGECLDRSPAQRNLFWQLLDEHGILAYICGHEHIYHRRTIDHSEDPRWQSSILQICCPSLCAPRHRLPNCEHDICKWGPGFVVIDLECDQLTVQMFDHRGRCRDRYQRALPQGLVQGPEFESFW
jgi:hypothetical protein